MTEPQTITTYRKMQQALLAGEGPESTILPADLLAEDALIETPFAPEGMRRYEGRNAWLAYYSTAGAGLLIDFVGFREIATHATADPEVLVVEYELTGRVRATGVQGDVTSIAVLRVRDGEILHWREYQDIPTITEALARRPE